MSSVRFSVICSEAILYPTLLSGCYRKMLFFAFGSIREYFSYIVNVTYRRIFSNPHCLKKSHSFYTGNICKPLNGSSHGNVCHGVNSIILFSAPLMVENSLWKTV